MKSRIIQISLTILLIISPFIISTCKSAGMGMGPPIPCGGPFNPCPIPLDNGVIVLLIAGAAYGGKKIIDSVKKNPA